MKDILSGLWGKVLFFNKNKVIFKNAFTIDNMYLNFCSVLNV